MNLKHTITAALAAGFLLAGTAAADTLRGEVYRVTQGDVYIEMPNHTVARVPAETAYFYVNGERTLWNSLRRGQNVLVDYTPVYGFQRYYHSEDDSNAESVYFLDVDTADVDEYIEYDGKVYRRVDL